MIAHAAKAGQVDMLRHLLDRFPDVPSTEFVHRAAITGIL